jgi:hypothetical protein
MLGLHHAQSRKGPRIGMHKGDRARGANRVRGAVFLRSPRSIRRFSVLVDWPLLQALGGSRLSDEHHLRHGTSNASRRRHSCWRRSAAAPSPRPASPSCSPVPARRRGWASRSTRTCFGMPAAMRWATRASIANPPGLPRPSLDQFDDTL